MKASLIGPTLILVTLANCSAPEHPSQQPLHSNLGNLPSIEGQSAYLSSPFVTAGSRVYIIGHQDGSFPDLGWHVDGEMGGIWDHPIKLMDGFAASIRLPGTDASFCLNKADKFVNYPMTNSHHFTWADQHLEIHRTQFVPDNVEGAVIEFRIVNNAAEDKEVTFYFTGMTDLRPTWLGERTGMTDAEDEVTFDESASAVVAKDKKNTWFAMFGSTMKGEWSDLKDKCITESRKGTGKDATLSFTLNIKGNGETVIPFFIAGSYESEDSLRATYHKLKGETAQLFAEKMTRYQNIAGTSRITVPDKDLMTMYEWLKYNTDWLNRDVPEIGSGITAGLPDYPWWFGADAAYTLQGVMASGDHRVARNTILLLYNISQKTNNNGRVIHEVSTNGAIYNPGNVNETAQFITLVYQYFSWTGDRETVAMIFPFLKKGIDWLLKEKDPDGNLYPNGSGMMEIPGLESDLEMIDVAVYTQQALASASELARALGETALADEYGKLAAELRVRINNEWWQPRENSYGDFLGTTHEALPIVEAALLRSDTLRKTWSVAELKQTQANMKKYPANVRVPHVIYHNWVVNTPMETGVADADKGRKALQKAKTYENPFGVFVTGIDRTAEPDSVVLKSRKKTFSYTGAVMTLPTGVQAVAAARYGSPDDALEYMHKLQRSFSYALPGSMYEVSPDFGMITQAWNIYGVAVPLVHHFFGIQPLAYAKSISIAPALPKDWNEAAIENVIVGDNKLRLNINRKADSVEYAIRQSRADWTVRVNVDNAIKVTVNEKEVEPSTYDGGWISLTGNDLKIKIQTR